MKVYLLRHAQTDANSKGHLSCKNDECLNAAGKAQSEELCEYLLKNKFDAIWTSPLPRAIATIKPYVLAIGGKYAAKPLLAEGNYNINPNEKICPPLYGEDGLPPQHEAVSNFRGRVQHFIELLLTQDPQKAILVMTHGQFIREFLNMFLGATRYVRWPVGNCSETLVEISEDAFIRHVNKTVIQSGTAPAD
jgi:uncharacterized phosphatase